MIDTLWYLLIYLAAPATALHLYSRLSRRMRRDGVRDTPDAALLLVFSAYGGLLMVALVAALGAWAEPMYFVLFYAVVVAPCAMLWVALSMNRVRGWSSYHRMTFIASAAYAALGTLVLAGYLMLIVGFIINFAC